MPREWWLRLYDFSNLHFDLFYLLFHKRIVMHYTQFIVFSHIDRTVHALVVSCCIYEFQLIFMLCSRLRVQTERMLSSISRRGYGCVICVLWQLYACVCARACVRGVCRYVCVFWRRSISDFYVNKASFRVNCDALKRTLHSFRVSICAAFFQLLQQSLCCWNFKYLDPSFCDKSKFCHRFKSIIKLDFSTSRSC